MDVVKAVPMLLDVLLAVVVAVAVIVGNANVMYFSTFCLLFSKYLNIMVHLKAISNVQIIYCNLR